MNKTQATTKLKKLLGKNLAWRENPKAPSPEERAQAQVDRPALIAAKQTATAAMEERRRALLAGDPEYQRLVAEWKQAKDLAEKNSSTTCSYRLTVGTSSNAAGFSFFSVKAEGDNWDEIVNKVQP